MKELYYPSFEIVDENWLKYAILYKENVSTIVPSDYRSKLSEQFTEIYKSTDLIGFYNVSRSDIEVITNASNVVLTILEDVFDKPESYSVNSYWKNYKNLDEILRLADRKYTIVSHKLNFPIERKLIEMGYAKRVNDGIEVNYILGCFYMSVLASVISGRNNDLVATTDINTANLMNRLVNEYLPISKPSPDYLKKDEVKQLIFKQSIPNLDQLSIQDTINIRNKYSYRKNLEGFNRVIENIINTDSGRNLDLLEIDRQLTFFSDEMEGIRRDVYGNIGGIVAKLLISTLVKDSVIATAGSEVVSTLLDSSKSNEIKVGDVLKTKRLITSLKGIK